MASSTAVWSPPWKVAFLFLPDPTLPPLLQTTGATTAWEWWQGKVLLGRQSWLLG